MWLEEVEVMRVAISTTCFRPKDGVEDRQERVIRCGRQINVEVA